MATMIVHQQPAVIRSAPSIRGGVLRVLKIGNAVEVASVLDGWAEVVSGGWLVSSTLTPLACDDCAEQIARRWRSAKEAC